MIIVVKKAPVDPKFLRRFRHVVNTLLREAERADVITRAEARKWGTDGVRLQHKYQQGKAKEQELEGFLQDLHDFMREKDLLSHSVAPPSKPSYSHRRSVMDNEQLVEQIADKVMQQLGGQTKQGGSSGIRQAARSVERAAGIIAQEAEDRARTGDDAWGDAAADVLEYLDRALSGMRKLR